MRLWHYKLIPFLPRQQLLGQHRECCALRGLGWGKKHSTVDYVFKYSIHKLFTYHSEIMFEMMRRGYEIKNPRWLTYYYRGKKLNYDLSTNVILPEDGIYPEHNDNYLSECLHNLKYKKVKNKIKNIDLFMHFNFIKDKGEKYEKIYNSF